MGKLPASLFYWGDFIRDPDLRRCSNAAVGVWIKCLCLMFECEQKGVLATNGIPWTDDDIALAVGGRWEDTNACLTELVTKGVASRNDAGSLICRRMYRDEKVRDDTRKRVQRFREKQDSNGECNAEGNANVRECTETETETESFETESLPSSKKNSVRKENPQVVAEQEEAIYEAYPRKAGRGAALTAIRKAVSRLVAGSMHQEPMLPHEARKWLQRRAADYAGSPAGVKSGDDDYRPHPATWFNQERYFDETSEWNRNGGNGNGKAAGNGNTVFDDLQQLQEEARKNRDGGKPAAVDAGEAGERGSGENVGAGSRGLW